MRPSVEERTEYNQTLFYICYFYLTRPVLSKAIPQGNSIFITKLVSCARGKAVLLLSLPLLFLLRSSQMLCLREINGFLNKLLSILWLLMFAPVITSRALREAAFWKLKSGVTAVRCLQEHQLLWWQLHSTPALPCMLITSPDHWAQWPLCTSLQDSSQVCNLLLCFSIIGKASNQARCHHTLLSKMVVKSQSVWSSLPRATLADTECQWPL